MFGRINLYVYLILGIILVGGTAGFLINRHIDNLNTKIEILQANNAALDLAVKTNEETINTLQNEYRIIQETNAQVNQAYAEIRRQNNYLMDKLGEHDIGALAAARPESIQRLINSGTANAGRCFEILSGSPLTEEEKNARNATAFNNECPWLWADPSISLR